MNKFKRYTSEDLSMEELEAISEKLIVDKFDRDMKLEWKEKLARQYQVYPHSDSTPGIPLWQRVRVWASVAAIGLLLLTAGIYFFNQPASYQLATQQYIHQLAVSSNPTLGRKGSVSEEELRLTANLAFAEKRYDEAISKYEMIMVQHKADSWDYFYLGVSWLKTKNINPEKTLLYLEQSESLGGPEAEIDWIKCLALLSADRLPAAKSKLKELVEQNHFMKTAAAELLGLLE